MTKLIGLILLVALLVPVLASCSGVNYSTGSVGSDTSTSSTTYSPAPIVITKTVPVPVPAPTPR